MKRKPKYNEKPIDETTVGFLIRKYRRLKGLSSTELGKMMGVTGENITAWERGNTCKPKLETRLKIAECLNIAPIWLFPELDSTTPLPPIKELADYSTLEIIRELERRCCDGSGKEL